MSPRGSVRRALAGAWMLLLALGAGCADAPAASGASTDPGPVAGPARRIVPANSGAAELLLALIGPERLAAIPGTVSGYAHADLSALELPTFQHYNAENVLAYDPDLVVTHAWQNSDATSFLQSRGVPVLALPDVGDLRGLLAIIETLGERLDAREEAARLTGDLRGRAARLGAVDRSAIRLVSYTNFGSGGWTAGAETTANLMCELAGVENLSRTRGRRGHTDVDFETLITWDPDVFLVGASGERPGYSPSAEVLRSTAALQSIEAVAQGRIIVLPAELYTTNSQRVMDAAEALAQGLDELFPPSSDSGR